MEQKIGQIMMMGVQGPTLAPEEAEFIINNNIGGVVLFARNLETPQQIHQLCTELHNLKNRQPDKAPLFIGIDMEGGRVHRLKPPFTQWPALAKIGSLDSTSMAFRFTLNMGQELRAMGINLNFAPCVDVLTNPDNVLIGDRSISSDPEQVGKMASALVRGYIKSGVLPCAKHFPGHGNTTVDSHEDLPVDDTDLETLMDREMSPFKKAFRARLDLTMTAHIKFTKVDDEWPVTLSEKFLKEILRDQLRYRSLVISDDLDMKALTNHYDKAVIPVQALKAGCNILLYCNEPDSPPLAIEAIKQAIVDGAISREHIEDSYKKVLKLKSDKFKDVAPLPMDEVARVVGQPDHLKVAKAINDGVVLEELQSS